MLCIWAWEIRYVILPLASLEQSCVFIENCLCQLSYPFSHEAARILRNFSNEEDLNFLMKVKALSCLILRIRVLQYIITINDNGECVLHETDPLLVTFDVKPLLFFLNGDIFNPGQLHLPKFLNCQWSLFDTIKFNLFPCATIKLPPELLSLCTDINNDHLIFYYLIEAIRLIFTFNTFVT